MFLIKDRLLITKWSDNTYNVNTDVGKQGVYLVVDQRSVSMNVGNQIVKFVAEGSQLLTYLVSNKYHFIIVCMLKRTSII